jgi:EH domain-containing protein 1
MGKILPSPEVLKVYVGSFWEKELRNKDNAILFEEEENDLMSDLRILPRNSAVRKINELVKRIRKVKVLAYLTGYLRAAMPALIGKEKKQAKLLNDLPNIFRTVMKKYNLAAGDFPDVVEFKKKLEEFGKFTDLKTLQIGMITKLEKVSLSLSLYFFLLIYSFFLTLSLLLLFFFSSSSLLLFRSLIETFQA